MTAPAAAGRGLRWSRRVLVAAGTLVMGYAVAGALTDPDVRPPAQLAFLAGVLIAHDAVVLPAAIGIGVLIGRFVPAPARTAVRVAGFVTVALVVVATPLVLGFGRPPGEESALPLNYGRALAAVLLLVWAAALATLLRSSTRRRRPPRARPPAE